MFERAVRRQGLIPRAWTVLTGFALATAATIAVLAPGTAAAGSGPTCRPSAHQVLGRSGTAVVFRRRTSAGGEYGEESALYACLKRRQRPLHLTSFGEGQVPKLEHVPGANPAFAGSYVALAYGFVEPACAKYMGGGPQCEVFVIASFNLRTGRVRATASLPASSLVVTLAGWIAWVSPTGQLEAVDSGGKLTLDGGPVEASSVRAAGETIRWSSAGTVHSAELR